MNVPCELVTPNTCLPVRGQRKAQGVVALGRAVGQKECPASPVGLRREPVGPVIRPRLRAVVDAVDEQRDVGRERVGADRLSHAGVRAGSALVPGYVTAGSATEGIGDDRVQVRCRRLFVAGETAEQITTVHPARGRHPCQSCRAPRRDQVGSAAKPTSRGVREARVGTRAWTARLAYAGGPAVSRWGRSAATSQPTPPWRRDHRP
jgi:hypothetical protein